MKMKLLAVSVALAIPLAGLAAERGTPDPQTTNPQTTDPQTTDPANRASGSASFDALDANKDGRISMPEASVDPKLVEQFSTADKDGDGYLDSSEYANAASAPPQQ
jgi:hypothetical protein